MHLHTYVVVTRLKLDTSGNLDGRGFFSSEEAVLYAENMLAEHTFDDEPTYSLVQVIDVKEGCDIQSSAHRDDWQREVEIAQPAQPSY